MSKQIFRLVVPAKPESEFVSHGNHDFELVANGIVETSDPRVRDWLIGTYRLELIETVEVEVEDDTVPAVETPADAETDAIDPETYPSDLPGRDALIKANVPFDTVKTLTADQLDEYPGIGPKTAADIVAYFAEGGTD